MGRSIHAPEGGKVTSSIFGWRGIAVLVAALLIPASASAGSATAPPNFRILQNNGFAVLQWDASGATSYRVYAGVDADNLTLAGTTTSLTFNTGMDGTDRWYAVGAFEAGALGPVSFLNTNGTVSGQCISISKGGGVGISIRDCVSL